MEKNVKGKRKKIEIFGANLKYIYIYNSNNIAILIGIY